MKTNFPVVNITSYKNNPHSQIFQSVVLATVVELRPCKHVTAKRAILARTVLHWVEHSGAVRHSLELINYRVAVNYWLNEPPPFSAPLLQPCVDLPPLPNPLFSYNSIFYMYRFCNYTLFRTIRGFLLYCYNWRYIWTALCFFAF